MKKHTQNKMYLKRQIISFMLVFVMLFSVLGAYLVPAENYYAATNVYVTGDFSNLSGCNITQKWVPGGSTGKMTYLRDGYYYKVVTFTETTAKKQVTYKFTFGSSWDNGEIGGGTGENGNNVVTVPSGISEFTILVDINKEIAYNSIDNPDDVEYIMSGATDDGTEYNYTIYVGSLLDDTYTAAGTEMLVKYGDKAASTYTFTEEEIAGKTWLKTSCKGTSKIDLTLRGKGGQSWANKTISYINGQKAAQTIYILDNAVYKDLDAVAAQTPDSYLLVEYGGSSATNKNVYVWGTGYANNVDAGETGLFIPFKVREDGKYVAKVPVKFNGETSKNIGIIVLSGKNWDTKESEDLSYTVKAGKPYAMVRFSNGEIANDVTNIKSAVIKNSNKITFNYRDNDAVIKNGTAYLGASNEVSVVMMTEKDGVKSSATEYDMTYNANEKAYTCSATIAEGANCYYYYKVNGTKIEDFNASNKQTVDGIEYSYVENGASDVSVTAKAYYDSMDYNDNNVISVEYKSNTGKELTIEHIYVDLSEVGQGSKVEIDKDLNEFTFGCSYDITPGVKTITVTVVDEYGTEYKADATVNVTKREKGDDFDWDEAVIYFAVTDRFFDGDASNNTVTESGKEYDKTNGSGIHGGDLKGLTTKLDELDALGINTIWITPIVDNFDGSIQGKDDYGNTFDTYGYHGYWAEDFTKLNPHLGTEEELETLIDEAHKRGIKIMVDVVLNHAGYGGEEVFNKILKNEDGSYKPMIRTESIQGDEEKWSLDGLPDFLTEDPEVRALLVEWQAAWLDRFDIDYYRVDTVKHVEDATWMAFKTALTKKDPTFKLIGEYYDGGYRNDFNQLDNSMMDSILDFHFNDILISGLPDENLYNVEKELIARNKTLSNTATMGSFLSSHDEDGFIYILKNKGVPADWVESLTKVAVTYQTTAKGQPVIYYGEELGMTGKYNWPQQENRYDYDWAGLAVQKNQTNSMYNHYKKMLNIRQEYLELFARGSRYSVTTPSSKAGYDVFAREYDGTTIYIGTNVWGDAQNVKFNVKGEAGRVYKDLYNNTTYTVSASGTITVTIPGARNGGTAVLALQPIEVTGITLDKTTATLTAGEAVQLTATVAPANATNKAVEWTTSDANVATVDNTGKVTAVAAGTATITAKAGDKTATCVVTVNAKVTEPEKPAVVEVTGITLDKTTATLTVGEAVQLAATVAPGNATNKAVTWSTSNAKVATVVNGKVTAVAAGTATITAKAGDKTATCVVTVNAKVVPVTGITLDKATATLKKGETVTLTATVNPSNATDKTVTWTTSNANVATVANGKVTAVADGTAVITAKAGNVTATCKITVSTPATEVAVTKVTLNKTTANIGVGKTLTLKATVTPKNATNQKLTWSSSNKKVATVDKNGKVKGVKAGTATITVKTANGKKATCKVTVVKATLNETSLALQVKKSVTLKATSSLKTDKVSSWKSSNTKVATVKSGKVTAKKAGTVTITVKSASGKKVTCKITVKKK